MKLSPSLRHLVSAVVGGLARLQVLWKEWDLRGFIIASFTLQLILTLLASFRKRTSNGLVIFPIWLSYLLADWVAVQAVGFIPKPTSMINTTAEHDLLAFWAQFLLLHLGGPDTITALALEDGELWLRTALHLGTQVYVTFGVLVKSIQRSAFWAPTLIMFVVGAIKYLERVLSLMRARLKNFDVEPPAEDDDHVKTVMACEPTTSTDHKQLTHVEMVRHAFYFFHYYKGLYANRIFNINEKRKSREYILRRTPEEAFLLLEIELNLAYEAFYTKATIIHRKLGMVFRPITVLLEVVCLVIWSLTKKHGLQNNDVIITYTLIIGAIVVDVIALCRILLSDWNIASLDKVSKIRSWIYNSLLSARSTRTWGKYKSKEGTPFLTCLRRAFFRRWSETVPQCNILDLCLEKQGGKTKKVIEYLGLKDMMDRYNYVTSKWFSDDLRNIIFEFLQPTSSLGGDIAIKEIYSSKDWLDWLKKYVEAGKYSGYPMDLYNLRFELSLLTHHVTTEYYYQLDVEIAQVEDKKRSSFINTTFGCGKDGSKVRHRDNNVYREFSKTISDYMLYLLIWQPDVMPISAGLCKKMFSVMRDAVRTRIDSEDPGILNEKNKARRSKKASAHLVSPDAEMNLEIERKWEMFAEVWLLHLCYVTTHAKPNFHATQLKQGGELLSFVWLLVVHLGLTKEPQIYFDDSGHSMVFIP